VRYYLQPAGREDIGPIHFYPPFVQRGHGIGSFLGGLFRSRKPVLWSGAKDLGKATFKAIGREVLRTGGKILTHIADNPEVRAHD